MDDTTSGGYDEGYKSCGCFWGTEPGSFLKLLMRYETSFIGRRVLDAGCGEGKNAVFLARLGADVDAIDVSAVAIKNARRAWTERPDVHWFVTDIRRLELPDNYDVVVAYGLLHCLSDRAEVLAVVSAIQAATVPGGYNVVCAFNSRRQELQEAHPGFNPCLLGHDEYLSLYASWGVLAQSDSDLTERHPHNKIEHTHSMTRILAKKIET